MQSAEPQMRAHAATAQSTVQCSSKLCSVKPRHAVGWERQPSILPRAGRKFESISADPRPSGPKRPGEPMASERPAQKEKNIITNKKSGIKVSFATVIPCEVVVRWPGGAAWAQTGRPARAENRAAPPHRPQDATGQARDKNLHTPWLWTLSRSHSAAGLH